ncbi:outer membrane protein assembly factor BamB family protein [Luteimonas sp. A611]
MKTASSRVWPTYVAAVPVLLFGLFMAVGGGILASAGGSWYFLLAGLGMTASAALMFMGRRTGAWLYAAVLLATVPWALREVGLEAWPLISRLFALGVIGLLVALAYPSLARRDGHPGRHRGAWGVAVALGACLAVGVVAMFTPQVLVEADGAGAAVTPVVAGERQSEWRHWGQDTAGTRFAALDQIDRDNVGALEVAWTARTGDIPESTGSGAEDQNTPLQIGTDLFVCTAYGTVLALDVDTGEEKWRFDPQATAPNWQRCRGLGYHEQGGAGLPVGSQHTADPGAPAQPPARTADPRSADGGTMSRDPTSRNATPPVAAIDDDAATEQAAEAGPEVEPRAASEAAEGVNVNAMPTSRGCRRRLFLPTLDARLIALDADTGLPCAGFGDGGTVDLGVGMGEILPGYYQQTSTPLVAGNVVVVGGRVADNFSVDEPPGVVRAFDAISGELAWAWDPGNPAITGLPPEGETYTRGTPNIWAAMSYDAALGLIYAPTGNATPDFWSGHRSELDERYSSAVVALDVATGRPRWHYQMTHRDLWDFDIPAQPLLYDLPDGNGGSVPALVQITKQGEIFVLDRRTGAPITEVVEKPVPQGDLPGERYAPTQPYSVGMPSIGNQTLVESDMWGATPVDQLLCRIQFKSMRHEGVYTPPGLDRSLQMPGSLGGMNWGGAAVDPTTHTLYVNDMRLGLANYMVRREDVPTDASGIEMGIVPMDGTPYGAMRERFLSQLGIPCQKPPFGTMTAIDLANRRILWQVPLGTVQDTGPLGIKMLLPIPIGMPTLGGPLSTQSGLVFFAGTQDYYLRALDGRTGETLWKGRLPVGSQAGPMTYVSPRTGRQYVVVTAGGARVSPDRGDYVIAYALPQDRTGGAPN